VHQKPIKGVKIVDELEKLSKAVFFKEGILFVIAL